MAYIKLAPDDPRRCRGTSRSTGVQCGRTAIQGGTVCHRHGGRAPQVLAASQRRMSEAKARREAERFLKKQGIPRAEDPLEELIVLASEATAYREVFRQQIDHLLNEDEVRYEHRAGEQLRAEMALWERSSERCLKIYSEIARLGIAERQTRIRQAELMIMAEGIREIMRRLDLSPDQKKLAVRVVPEVLRELEAPREVKA